MSLFPLNNSPQRLNAGTSATQKNAKVPLRAGFSLMDWVRLTKSGKDLRGIGSSRMLKVTPEELAKHNKRHDAWMAIRGFVYNVTTYMDYHPGGDSELMRGVGTDGTQLFEEVHRWVNFESMLGACLVGKLEQGLLSVQPKSSATKSTLSAPKSANAYKGLSLPKPPVFSDNTSTKSDGPQIVVSSTLDLGSPQKAKPTTSWHQSVECVTLVCYTKLNDLDKRSSVACDLTDNGGQLTAEILTHDSCITLDLKLRENVKEKVVVSVSGGVGKVEIRLYKRTAGTHWTDIGDYGPAHCETVERKNAPLRYRACRLMKKSFLTHDTSLYHFQLPESSWLTVPIGYHVYFEAQAEGMAIARPYTVVGPNISQHDAQSALDGRNFYAMIKSYDNGALTPVIRQLQVGDEISVSTCEGNFKLGTLEGRSRVVLLAAGTGFTPMARLIGHCLRKHLHTNVHLEFFNKTIDDIPWKDELDQLVEKYGARFTVEHVLSQPDEKWIGKIGRITLTLLKDILKAVPAKDDELLVCICGPKLFTELGLKFLKDLGVKSKSIHAFFS